MPARFGDGRDWFFEKRFGMFFADPDEPGRAEAPDAARFIRLPFCALTEEQIDEGMRRLARAVRA